MLILIQKILVLIIAFKFRQQILFYEKNSQCIHRNINLNAQPTYWLARTRRVVTQIFPQKPKVTFHCGDELLKHFRSQNAFPRNSSYL